jgi:hypothetical protein
MGWMAEKSGLDSQEGQDIFLHNLQTGSEAHPASYTIHIGGCFPGGMAARVKMTTQVHLMLALRIELYPHSPIHLHGFNNWAQG